MVGDVGSVDSDVDDLPMSLLFGFGYLIIAIKFLSDDLIISAVASIDDEPVGRGDARGLLIHCSSSFFFSSDPPCRPQTGLFGAEFSSDMMIHTP